MAGTSVVVRAQAVGGKFLGKAVCSTPAPTLEVLLNGQQVAVGTFTTGNSGQVLTNPTDMTTPNTIVVQDNSRPSVYQPGTYYLAPVAGASPDSLVTVELPLTDTPQTFEFLVTASNSETRTITASYSTSLSIGTVPAAGVVVPIPGLRITNASAVSTPVGTRVTASVAMMCGCMITPLTADPVEAYWPESEFTVIAQVADTSEPMQCIGNSIFTVTLPAVTAGTQVLIRATQQGIAVNENEVLVKVTG